jgi:hypothetical protein
MALSPHIDPVDMKKIDQDRLNMLGALYQFNHANHGKRTYYPRADVQSVMGTDDPSYVRAFLFLRGLKYVEGTGYGDHIGITVEGMLAYEASRREPDKQVGQLPAINIVFANTIRDSNVQLSGEGSSQVQGPAS